MHAVLLDNQTVFRLDPGEVGRTLYATLVIPPAEAGKIQLNLATSTVTFSLRPLIQATALFTHTAFINNAEYLCVGYKFTGADLAALDALIGYPPLVCVCEFVVTDTNTPANVLTFILKAPLHFDSI